MWKRFKPTAGHGRENCGRESRLGVGLAFLLIFGLAGCYTTFRPPSALNETGKVYDSTQTVPVPEREISSSPNTIPNTIWSSPAWGWGFNGWNPYWGGFYPSWYYGTGPWRTYYYDPWWGGWYYDPYPYPWNPTPGSPSSPSNPERYGRRGTSGTNIAPPPPATQSNPPPPPPPPPDQQQNGNQEEGERHGRRGGK